MGALAIMSAGASFVVACVSDDTDKETDASTPDSSIADTSPGSDVTTTNDAGVDSPNDAGFIFDGSGADCNAIDPLLAPALATVECADAAPSVNGSGGAIPPGRYYLSDQEFFPALCAQDKGPFDDVVEIVALDGGSAYSVNVGLSGSGTGAARLSLLWTITSTGHFTQTTSCPQTQTSVQNAPYNITVNNTTTTIQYALPGAEEITLTSF
jgi:hypothetical protein